MDGYYPCARVYGTPVADAPRPIRSVGLVGEAREALPATLDALRAIAARFAAARVDIVVALGDMGASREDVRGTLGALAGAGGPIAALPGPREPYEAWRSAVAQAGAIDLSATRALRSTGPGADVLTLPGAPTAMKHLMRAGALACAYAPEDIAALAALAASLDGPILMVGHWPPRGDGPSAIDRAWGGAGAGDPALAAFLVRTKIGLGAFTHFEEAPGATAPEATWSRALLINVGPADSVPHRRLDGSLAGPEAARIEIAADGRARWFRVAP